MKRRQPKVFSSSWHLCFRLWAQRHWFDLKMKIKTQLRGFSTSKNSKRLNNTFEFSRIETNHKTFFSSSFTFPVWTCPGHQDISMWDSGSSLRRSLAAVGRGKLNSSLRSWLSLPQWVTSTTASGYLNSSMEVIPDLEWAVHPLPVQDHVLRVGGAASHSAVNCWRPPTNEAMRTTSERRSPSLPCPVACTSCLFQLVPLLLSVRCFPTISTGLWRYLIVLGEAAWLSSWGTNQEPHDMVFYFKMVWLRRQNRSSTNPKVGGFNPGCSWCVPQGVTVG